MKAKQVNDTVLVKYYVRKTEDEDFVCVGSCYTEKCPELIQTLVECYKNQIEIKFNEFTQSIDKEYSKDYIYYYISDLEFQLGTQEDLFVLNVYLE